jgi:hypothetical protein
VGWLDFFQQRKGDEPQENHEVEELGPMRWSEDAEAWAGQHNGIRFLIAYEGPSTPTQELLGYAREMLADPAKLLRPVDSAKAGAVAENPGFAEEIAGFCLDLVHFYRHNAARRIIADLAGGKRGRSWRVEFRERDCEGIGFDT